MKKINEDNLPGLMHENYRGDWGKTFSQLYAQMKNEKKQYDSISSNFFPIFILELIKIRVDISTFDKTMKEIFSSASQSDVSNTFSRFFDTRHDKSFDEYQRGDDSLSCWDNMAYIFRGHHDGWCLENTRYLAGMMSALHQYNILGVYEGLYSFLYQFELKELTPLIEAVDNNPLYRLEKPGYNENFINTIISIVATKSYICSDEKNKENAEILKSVADIESLYRTALISYRDSAGNPRNSLKINMGMMNFLISAGIDTCTIIHDAYRADYDKRLQDVNSSRYMRKTKDEISSSLSVGLKRDVDFRLDIDMSQPLEANYVMMKYLENKIVHGGHIDGNIEPLRDYLVKERVLEEKKPSYEQLDINYGKILKYLDYENLLARIPQKSETKKPKI